MENRPCKCTLHCFENVHEEQRKKLFSGFWGSANFDVQNSYLCGCVKVIQVKRRYTSNASSRRSHSRVYYVSNGSVSVRVCKTAFLRIHAISNWRLDRALRVVMKNGGSPHYDARGHHEPGNKTTEDDLSVVKQHIESFPQYRSHYSRSDNPNRKYLSPMLTISKMYSLYQEDCDQNMRARVSEWIYRKTFNKCFNLSFGR